MTTTGSVTFCQLDHPPARMVWKKVDRFAFYQCPDCRTTIPRMSLEDRLHVELVEAIELEGKP